MAAENGNGNGSNGWRAWLLAACAGLLFSGATLAWTAMSNRVDQTQSMLHERSERIARLEVEMLSLKESLARIEAKLDRTLADEARRR